MTNYISKPKAIVIENFGKKYLCNPLSSNTIAQIEDMGGDIEFQIRGNNTEYNTLTYRIFFPDAHYMASIIKGYSSYGREKDLCELAVLDLNGYIEYGTEITDDVLGFLEEEDVLSVLRIIKRLDNNGHIRPIMPSQN